MCFRAPGLRFSMWPNGGIAQAPQSRHTPASNLPRALLLQASRPKALPMPTLPAALSAALPAAPTMPTMPSLELPSDRTERLPPNMAMPKPALPSVWAQVHDVSDVCMLSVLNIYFFLGGGVQSHNISSF